MSKISKKFREHKQKAIGDHKKFLSRITKTLYYGKLPSTDSLSLPVTELAAEIFSESQHGRSLDRLHCNDAAVISQNACVSPCSLILAVLYLEKLKACNPDYLQRVAPSELFLVSLMVSSKFLYDDGEDDEVFTDEWAVSGGLTPKELNQLEMEFLEAIKWNVFVHEHVFWDKLKAIERAVAKREGLNRGWFTYTELDKLLDFIDLQNLLNCIASFSAILLLTYTAGFLTILSSVLIVSHLPGTFITQTPLPAIEDTNATEFMDTLDTTKTDSCKNNTKIIDAVDVLKTGIILASIKMRPTFNETSDAEFISWDWWQSPTMVWLSRTSQIVEKFDVNLDAELKKEEKYMEVSYANSKQLDLEDQVHKATKMRLQEQMERSWHKEWTDMFQKLTRMDLIGYLMRSVNC